MTTIINESNTLLQNPIFWAIAAAIYATTIYIIIHIVRKRCRIHYTAGSNTEHILANKQPPARATKLSNPDNNYTKIENNTEHPTDSLKALIIDSNNETLKSLHKNLQPHFKQILASSDGSKGYEIAATEYPDVIISDIHTENMNGYNLCDKIKSNSDTSHIPIILLACNNDSEAQSLSYKSGADISLPKSTDANIILAAIRSLLTNREHVRLHQNRIDNQIIAESNDSTISNADELFMIKLNDYIFDNIDKDIDVESIASFMCMSRAALYKKLKAIIDIGAMEYVTKIRLTSAAAKLRKTDLSVAEIAIQSGYTDNQYFSKAFKQFHEHSPSQYRKIHSKKHN